MKKPYAYRKHPRLKTYDYSLPGAYFITIQSASNSILFSRIVPSIPTREASVHLTALGKVAEQQLISLEQRYPQVTVDKYVIMPSHIHAILILSENGRDSKNPTTLTDIVCAYKSLTTRTCNMMLNTPGNRIFQTSFYETVLRNEAAYRECWRYIDGNPSKWLG